MMFKHYLAHVSKRVLPDSENPTDIVQMLACLIGSRLSQSGRLPLACGRGDNLDLDIVQAGIVAGLERIGEYDSAQGTMRQFLYPTMAGAMANYAWERENRVSDSRPITAPTITSFIERATEADAGYREEEEREERAGGEQRSLIERDLVDPNTPETLLEAEQDARTAYAGVRAAIAGLGREATAMLLRDAQIGYNAAARAAWAAEIGVTPGALSVRLSRLRRDARDWACTVQ